MKIITGLFLCLSLIISVTAQSFQIKTLPFKINLISARTSESLSDSALSPQTADDGRCQAADPSRTHLTVRSNPNGGKIVRRLKNGIFVYVVYTMNDTKGRSWSKFSLSNKDNSPIIGWVLSQALTCR